MTALTFILHDSHGWGSHKQGTLELFELGARADLFFFYCVSFTSCFPRLFTFRREALHLSGERFGDPEITNHGIYIWHLPFLGPIKSIAIRV